MRFVKGLPTILQFVMDLHDITLIKKKTGIKDIDIWFFFSKNAENRFNPRWCKSKDLGLSKFGNNPNDIGYAGRRIDFFGRSVDKINDDAAESVRHWIQYDGGASSRYLAQKAVIGLYPDTTLGKPIWINPELKQGL